MQKKCTKKSKSQFSPQNRAEIQAKCKKAGIVTYCVQDAGRTQIPAGSKTVLAIGPGIPLHNLSLTTIH